MCVCCVTCSYLTPPPRLFALLSHAGLDVHLLDPPGHVPDPEVSGDHRRRDFPRREPHAGPESSEEVRALMTPVTCRGPQRAVGPGEEALTSPSFKRT